MSRLGLAVAICVSIVVGFSVGWVFLIVSFFRPDHLGIPLIMGSPLYGTAAAAMEVASTVHNSFGREARFVIRGALIWTCIHLGAGVILFGATLASFNHCLGRMSEWARAPRPRASARSSSRLEAQAR